MLDLNVLPARYLAQYGSEKIAEVCGITTSQIGMWQKRGKFPLNAVQKLLEFDPAPLHEIKPLYTNPETPPKLVILVPTTGPVDSRTMECLCAMKEPGMKLKTIRFWSSFDARNMLAAHHLASGAEWAYWSDSDMLPSFGDAKAWKQLVDAPQFPDVYAGIHTINRLLYHKKSLIGVAYRGRKRGAGFEFAGSSSIEIKELMKRGPTQRIIEREWVGFGGMLMHRRVLEDIISKQGNEIRVQNETIRSRLGYEYCFFAKEDKEIVGDDIGFQIRAKRAGHACFVDLSLFASHASSLALNYSDA